MSSGKLVSGRTLTTPLGATPFGAGLLTPPRLRTEALFDSELLQAGDPSMRRPSVGSIVACFLLVCLVGNALAQPPVDNNDVAEPAASRAVFDADYFDQRVFVGQTLQEVWDAFHLVLADRVQELENLCALTPEQARKLHLAGRVEIVELFGEIDLRRRRFHQERQQVLKTDVQLEVVMLDSMVTVSNQYLFRDHSLFDKVARATLTDEQRRRYEEDRKQCRTKRHCEWRDYLFQSLQHEQELSVEQQLELNALLDELPSVSIGPAAFVEAFHVASQVPPARYQQILDQHHWQRLETHFVSSEKRRRDLQRLGFLPERIPNSEGRQ